MICLGGFPLVARRPGAASKESRLGRRVSERIVAGRVWGLGGGYLNFDLFWGFPFVLYLEAPGLRRRRLVQSVASRGASLLVWFGGLVVGVCFVFGVSMCFVASPRDYIEEVLFRASPLGVHRCWQGVGAAWWMLKFRCAL